MAGGRGERLYPLTKERSKPAVPFGGKYRIMDFVMSNFVNSGIVSLYVLVQYLSQSLIEYLRIAWRSSGVVPHHFITVVPPQQRYGEMWYRGTADAVAQNINLIYDFNPDVVAIFGADHIYRMDISQMVDFHMENKSDVTVAALPVPVAEAHRFGVIVVDSSGKIKGFQEKPKEPAPMPEDSKFAFASMGNYIFNKDILLEALHEDERRSTEHDFGKTIIPDLVPYINVYAYNFKENTLPGVKPYEENGYWRDVGDIGAFFNAHMDLLGTEPVFDLHNSRWPIYAGGYHGPSPRILGGDVEDVIVGEGCVLEKAKVRRSILGRNVHVAEGAVIEDSILMDFCRIGRKCKMKRAIVDRFNSVPDKTVIGKDSFMDAQRFYVDEDSGIVVIPRGKTAMF